MDISESQSGGPGQEERVKEEQEQVIEEDWHTPPRGHGSDSKPAPHGVELLWTEQRKGRGTGTQVGGTHRWHPG